MGQGKDFYARHCAYLPAMSGWFACSAALSSYNKVIFGAEHGAFPCPLLLTSVHFLVQWTFSYVISTAFPKTFGGDDLKAMPWKTYLSVSIPCGFVTAADVGLSNLSLVRISITFFTMVKSSAPIWVLLSAFIFGIEKITMKLITVGVLIVAGELLAALGETDFDSVGFFMCLSAAILGGIRWTLVQFKLQKMDPPLKGSVATMRVLSSSGFFCMLLFSIVVERPWVALGPEGGGDYFADTSNTLRTVFLGLVGAFIAIAMVLCEFWLILKTNAIVLMIGGVLKELITIFVGVVAFGDNLNAINIAGIFVVFLGVFLYKITLLYSKMACEEIGGIDDDEDVDLEPEFAPVHSNELFEVGPDLYGRAMTVNGKRFDPDLALTARFNNDDEEEYDKAVLTEMTGVSFQERVNEMTSGLVHNGRFGEKEGNPGIT